MDPIPLQLNISSLLEALPDFGGILADFLWCNDEDLKPQVAERQ